MKTERIDVFPEMQYDEDETDTFWNGKVKILVTIDTGENISKVRRRNKLARMRLNNPKKNKVAGFYALMTNCQMYCDKDETFTIERKYLRLLKEQKIDFTEIPLYK